MIPPRTFVMDVSIQGELSQTKRAADNFDMTAVDAIMKKASIIDAVVNTYYTAFRELYKDKAHSDARF
ncbi:hypothetical protein [Candidatus Williamhamiltonella defendens]|uniref:hypothetical protein n=1 Tax=Candidatus Williamhamiltonella defendens TaxID=138072 RepID=UPI001C9DAEF1|nr:hypothetical protein [Candidatus Hamiltonella defensa]